MARRSANEEGAVAMPPSDQLDPLAWVDHHGDALYRFALARLNDPHRAEDVVQETFVAALAGRESFSARSSERTWLIGILKHKLTDHLRRAHRQQPAGTGEDIEQGLDEYFTRRGVWKTTPARWKGNPDRHLEQREFWEVFQRCLSGLPSRLAEAFALREMDGLSGEETRKLLGVSPTNLWTLLHRARLHLRRCLEVRWFRPPKKRENPC